MSMNFGIAEYWYDLYDFLLENTLQEHGEIWGRLKVGWGKATCWSTKAAIYLRLKHVKIEEKLLWRAYKNLPMLFRTVSLPTPYAPFPRLEFATATQNSNLYYLRNLWSYVRTSNLASTFTGSIRTNAHKIFWRTGSLGVSMDWPNFWVAPVISRTVKGTNCKFCTHIHRLNRNKSTLKISGKVAMSV